jgi:hypothetical protein
MKTEKKDFSEKEKSFLFKSFEEEFTMYFVKSYLIWINFIPWKFCFKKLFPIIFVWKKILQELTKNNFSGMC